VWQFGFGAWETQGELGETWSKNQPPTGSWRAKAEPKFGAKP